MLDGTYLSRNLATLGPLDSRREILLIGAAVGDSLYDADNSSCWTILPCHYLCLGQQVRAEHMISEVSWHVSVVALGG